MQGLRDTLGAALAEVGACPGGEPGPHAQAERFAEGLAEAADAAVGSREACERVVQLAREAFLDAAGSDDLLECAMMTVTRPLGRCADAADSAVAAATLRAVLERMAERCNARDAVVELLAALDDGSSGGAGGGSRAWRCSDAAALRALPLALARARRQRTRLLSDALAAALARLPPAFAAAHALAADPARPLQPAAGAARPRSDRAPAAAAAPVSSGGRSEPAPGGRADVVADAGAFAEALAGLPGAWGPEEGAAAAEAARVFALRLLAEATAGRAVEPDLARSDLAALHPGAAAALAALARGGGGGAALTARMAAALLRALPQVEGLDPDAAQRAAEPAEAADRAAACTFLATGCGEARLGAALALHAALCGAGCARSAEGGPAGGAAPCAPGGAAAAPGAAAAEVAPSGEPPAGDAAHGGAAPAAAAARWELPGGEVPNGGGSRAGSASSGPGRALLAPAAAAVALLLEAAGERRSEALAGKALALAAAAAAAGGCGQAPSAAAHTLLRLLAATAAGNPVAALRNAAFLALDAVLSSLQAGARLDALDELLGASPPALAAALLPRLARDAAAAWPRAPGEAGSGEWAVLRPRLLPAALAWLDPGGQHGWGLRSGQGAGAGLAATADPAAAAANLVLFLLVREAAGGSDLTGVRSAAALADLERQCLGPLRAAAGRAAAAAAADGGGGGAGAGERALALGRLLEVLARVSQVADAERRRLRAG